MPVSWTVWVARRFVSLPRIVQIAGRPGQIFIGGLPMAWTLMEIGTSG